MAYSIFCYIFIVLNVILATQASPSNKRSLDVDPKPKSGSYSDKGQYDSVGGTFKFSDVGEGEPLCDAITHTVYPKLMKNENNIERLIINVEDHKQGLIFETCVENSKCKYESLFPTASKCTQRYARRKLMAMVDGKPTFETFLVPSHCLCTLMEKN